MIMIQFLVASILIHLSSIKRRPFLWPWSILRGQLQLQGRNQLPSSWSLGWTPRHPPGAGRFGTPVLRRSSRTTVAVPVPAMPSGWSPRPRCRFHRRCAEPDSWVWINTYENTIFRGMNIHKFQLFWCELQGYKVLTHPHFLDWLVDPKAWLMRKMRNSSWLMTGWPLVNDWLAVSFIDAGYPLVN